MATIRKRGNKWQAQVRRNGRVSVSKSFNTKCDSQVLAKQTEINMERIDIGLVHGQLRQITLEQLLVRYLREVTQKRGADVERTANRNK